jgi:arylformamidase
MYFAPDVPAYLHAQGIGLIGVDMPSVDHLESKELPAHHGFLTHDIYILEGLDLAQVAPNDYELIALPLKLTEADGSPVRALLRTYG